MDAKVSSPPVTARTLTAEDLVIQLVQRQDKGAAALVIVDGYPERSAIVCAIQAQARIYDIEVQALSDIQWPAPTGPNPEQLKGLVFLVDAGRTTEWAEWLDTHREEFLDCARFVVVIVLETEAAAFLRHAPSFFSWIKGHGYRLQAQQPVISREEIEDSLKRMTEQTQLTPKQFIAYWRAGNLKDTFQNNYWLNLAQLWVESGEDGHEQ